MAENKFAVWYNWKESHSEQFQFFAELLFLFALNLILSYFPNELYHESHYRTSVLFLFAIHLPPVEDEEFLLYIMLNFTTRPLICTKWEEKLAIIQFQKEQKKYRIYCSMVWNCFGGMESWYWSCACNVLCTTWNGT